MHLNGKPYQVKGICCHEDHAGVGAAVSTELMEYRVSLLKKLGINAYRCAHHIDLFHGRAQLIVTAGGGTIEAQCDGLPDVKL